MLNRAVVITVSDRCHRGEVVDGSGPEVIELLPKFDAYLVHHEIVPDDVDQIHNLVQHWLGRTEIIVTTGGTGIGARDVTPEAIGPLIERNLPGFGEIMRSRTFDQTPLAIVSRNGAGIARDTLIVWLPGGARAVRECIAWVTPAILHVCEFLRGQMPHRTGETKRLEPLGGETDSETLGGSSDRDAGSDRLA